MKSISLSEAPAATAAPDDLSSRVSAALPGVVICALLFAMSLANGGFNPPDWSWGTLAATWAIGLVLLLKERIELSVGELVMICSLGLLTLWTFLSDLWSPSVATSTLGGERTLLYLTVAVAVLLLARRGSAVSIAAGVLAAATLVMCSGLKFLADPGITATKGIAQTGRLIDPMGYWNAMGLMGVIGILLALGLASRRESPAAMWLLTALTLPVLAVGTYLTFSRGAWIAIVVGYAVAWLADPQRLRLLAVTVVSLPWLALDLLVTSRSPALTHVGSPVGTTSSQGHRLILVMAVGGVGLLASVAVIRRLRLDWVPSKGAVRGAQIAGLVVVILLLLSPLAFGGYSSAEHSVADTLSARGPVGFSKGSANLNDRLLQVSGEGRIEMWRGAWHEFTAHPLTGGGSGDFAAYWLQHRPTSIQVTQAHSLYLQTVAELGAVGLLLLLAVLLPPLYFGWRYRGSAMTPLLLGAYAGFLVHNATDWDWSLPALALFGLVCGVALLPAGRGRDRVWRMDGVWRIAAGVGVVVILLGTVYALRVNLAITASTSDAAVKSWHSSVSQAETATSWAPWFEDGWVALGNARLGAGDRAGAAVAFRHATREVPQDWAAWYGLARATRGAASLAALNHALRVDPLEPALIAYKQAHPHGA